MREMEDWHGRIMHRTRTPATNFTFYEIRDVADRPYTQANYPGCDDSKLHTTDDSQNGGYEVLLDLDQNSVQFAIVGDGNVHHDFAMDQNTLLCIKHPLSAEACATASRSRVAGLIEIVDRCVTARFVLDTTSDEELHAKFASLACLRTILESKSK